MPKFLTKQDFLSLVTKKKYNTEEEFENDIKSKLPTLLDVDKEQVTNQFYTLGFDGPQHNRADIVIKSKEEVPHALIVIELKIDRFIDKFDQENFTRAANQLRKYCQNIKALYGVILTEEKCLMYKFNYRQLGSWRDEVSQIPFPDKIDKEHAREAMIDAILHRSNFNYFLVAICSLIYTIILAFLRLIGR